jgi:predicted AAA+ superfamily ATPase
MPGVCFDGIDPDVFYSAYFRTYVERDVRMLINVSNQTQFETFVRLLAGRTGQISNLHALASDVGVSSATLASWLSVLEASYIVFRLPPYYNNFGKRLIKSPKIYFTEVGLACWLLGIEKATQVARDPLLGGLFENMVIVEAMKRRLNAGKVPNLYYFRDQRGMEVDLLVSGAGKLLPIEIKSAMTYDLSFAKSLLSFCRISEQATSPTVVFSGEQRALSKGVEFIRFSELADKISAWESDA